MIGNVKLKTLVPLADPSYDVLKAVEGILVDLQHLPIRYGVVFSIKITKIPQYETGRISNSSVGIGQLL